MSECTSCAHAKERAQKHVSMTKEDKNPTGGLSEKGREKHNRETGSNLQRPQPEGGKRKDSFCARMSGVKGPMTDEKGEPTRKALALKKWNC